MMDILMLGLGFLFFALAIGYTYACERLWGAHHDLRLCARRRRLVRPPGLSHLRAAAAGTVL